MWNGNKGVLYLIVDVIYKLLIKCSWSKGLVGVIFINVLIIESYMYKCF